MPLAYLPTFHDDELFYSVVARYARHRQVSMRQVNTELFGNPNVKLAYDIPLNIGQFVATIGDEIALTGNQIVERHTLLAYYTALRGPGAFDRFREHMLAGERIFRQVKGSQTAVPWPRQLRFCTDCDAEARSRYGYPIWLRRHQLVTSLVYLEHGKVLMNSAADVTIDRETRLVPAGSAYGKIEPVAPDGTDRVIALYRDLTAFGHAMLASSDDDHGWSIPDLRKLAWRKGYTDGTFTLMKDLIADFEIYYGEVLQLWPRLQSWEGRSRHWLRNLFDDNRYTKDPVCRALIRCFLEQRPDAGGRRQNRRGITGKVQQPPKPSRMSAKTAPIEDPIIAEKVRRSAEQLRVRSPPNRITTAILVRTIPGLQSRLRIYSLPLTEAAIAQNKEDHHSFARRRLRWIFAEARSSGHRVDIHSVLGWNITKDTDLIREEWARFYGS